MHSHRFGAKRAERRRAARRLAHALAPLLALRLLALRLGTRRVAAVLAQPRRLCARACTHTTRTQTCVFVSASCLHARKAAVVRLSPATRARLNLPAHVAHAAPAAGQHASRERTVVVCRRDVVRRGRRRCRARVLQPRQRAAQQAQRLALHAHAHTRSASAHQRTRVQRSNTCGSGCRRKAHTAQRSAPFPSATRTRPRRPRPAWRRWRASGPAGCRTAERETPGSPRLRTRSVVSTSSCELCDVQP
jgi:hypothetical protein